MTSLAISDGVGATPMPDMIDAFPLGGQPDAPALVWSGGTITYADLEAAVAREVAQWGPARRLVVLRARNDVRTVVTWLAAWAGRHPVLLLAADDPDRSTEILARFPAGPGHDLHPDLALLMSTSGSTGSPRLVRLSRDGVVANARSIAEYLQIHAEDRAITALPLHYCYGLSVLTSHLVAGASVVLTECSVAEEGFWRLMAEHRVTSLAGVPYTFELLEATGFADRDLPHLRYLTQAGGAMAPDLVRRYATLGREQGWDLFVMYGQTEATARIAYLPPDLALRHPDMVGVAIPGGQLRLGPDSELIYTGPNVMMGYATTPADLARGRDVHELHTGDRARQGPDGLWQITGRLTREAKIFGLRVDLDRVERQVQAEGHRVRLVEADGRLHAFTDRARGHQDLRRVVARGAGLAPAAVHVHRVDRFPLTSRGKCNYPVLARQAVAGARLADACLREVFAVTLGRPDATDADSFVSLGGDSLSYVEVSTHLARRLGHLPTDWPTTSIAALEAAPRTSRRFTTPVEMGVVLRALAMVLILLTHTDLWLVPGGAHVLLAVTGYLAARFALPAHPRRLRVGRLLQALAAVAVPASAWILTCALLTGEYRIGTAFYLNALTGADTWDANWQFWFLEVLVWSYLGLAAVLVVPWLDRAQRRHEFGFALGVLATTLAVRYLAVGVQADGLAKYSIAANLWVLALGWTIAVVRTERERALVAIGCVVAVAGFFGDPVREALVAVSLLALLWLPSLPVPRPVAGLLHLVAGASLWIYLTHWQVYPQLEAAGHPAVAVMASLVVGIVAAALYRRGLPLLLARLRCAVPARLASGAWANSGWASPDGPIRPGVATSTHPGSASATNCAMSQAS